MLNIDDFLLLTIRLGMLAEDLRDGLLAMCDEMNQKSPGWHPQRCIDAINELLDRGRMSASAINEAIRRRHR